jgi:hypothetical protein
MITGEIVLKSRVFQTVKKILRGTEACEEEGQPSGDLKQKSCRLTQE